MLVTALECAPSYDPMLLLLWHIPPLCCHINEMINEITNTKHDNN